MDERLKKRLVGAALLTSLVVIFVPMLFEEDSRGHRGGALEIPPRPEAAKDLSTRILPAQDEDLARARAPAPPVEIEPIPAVQPKQERAPTAPSASTDPDTPAPEPTPSKSRGPSAWVLQVASFSSKKNADQLVKRLRAKRFPAFQEEAQVNQKTIFRVRIGPEVDRKLAEQMLKRVSTEVKLEGRIMRYP